MLDFSTASPSRMEHGSERAQRTVCKVLGRIQKDWGFSNAEMARLLHVKPNTYGQWFKQKRVPIGRPPWPADMESVITVMAIHRSLGAMFQSAEDQILWLQGIHPDFAGLSPLNLAIQSVAGLYYLKAYLDYVRGRGA